jgi:hypothetical protein
MRFNNGITAREIYHDLTCSKKYPVLNSKLLLPILPILPIIPPPPEDSPE